MVSVEDATTATRSLGAHASPTCYPNGSDNLQAMRGNHHYEVLLTRKIESSTASVSRVWRRQRSSARSRFRTSAFPPSVKSSAALSLTFLLQRVSTTQPPTLKLARSFSTPRLCGFILTTFLPLYTKPCSRARLFLVVSVAS
jgi:hypothetical protein